MATYDVKRELKALYAPRNTTWDTIEVPKQQFLAIDGSGDPNTTPEYAAAVQALYALAYTVKFESKNEASRDFVVAPLEGLWSSPNPGAFTTRTKDAWEWTMLISQPNWITEGIITTCRERVLAKKKSPEIGTIRRLVMTEGRCAQALHVGSYDDEGPLLAELHGAYFTAHGLDFAGPHHEIYLSDPRRTSPAKLRTILRQPVQPEPLRS